MDLGLRGRTAIVCGASSGLGLASAEALAVDLIPVAAGCAQARDRRPFGRAGRKAQLGRRNDSAVEAHEAGAVEPAPAPVGAAT